MAIQLIAAGKEVDIPDPDELREQFLASLSEPPEVIDEDDDKRVLMEALGLGVRA